jgi:PAS domain S-box-containing protein
MGTAYAGANRARRLTAMRNDLLLSTALLEALEKRLEREASERQRLADFFHFAPEPYVVTNAEGIIQEANVAAASLLGVRVEAVVGKPLATFFAVGARAGFRSQLRRLATAECESARWQTRLRTRTQATLPAEVGVRAIRDPAARGLCWSLRTL